jgi:hypothetical protein
MKIKISERGQGETIVMIILACIIIYAVTQTATSCSNSQRKAEIQQTHEISNFIISGKVVNSTTGEWTNDRLVLLFLHNKEVSRATTSIGQSPFSQEGTHDGLFTLYADNPYGIKMDELGGDKTLFSWQETTWGDGTPIGNAYAYLDNFEEGSSYEIPVPAKNVSYIVKVIGGNINNLPPSLLVAGSAILRDNGAIVVTLPNTPENQTPGTENLNAMVQGIDYNTSSQTIDVNKFTVPIDNCAGSVRVSQKYTQSQTFIHEYHQETSAGVSVEIPLFFIKIVPEIQTRYGYENGQIETKTVEYDMAAEPQTKVTYIVTWQEVWESGVAEITSGTDLIEVPFKAKTNLIYKIESEPATCQ